MARGQVRKPKCWRRRNRRFRGTTAVLVHQLSQQSRADESDCKR